MEGLLQEFVWGLAAAVLAYALRFLQVKARESKANTAKAVDDLVDRRVEAHVLHQETLHSQPKSGREKFEGARAGIENDLEAIGKAVGKAAITGVQTTLAERINGAVRRLF